MANGAEKSEGAVVKKDELDVRIHPAASTLLAGAEKFVGGEKPTHTSIAINVVTNSNDLSTIMIPDVENIGGGPVYITRPVMIHGPSLRDFINAKVIKLDKKVEEFIADTYISCEAFYYTEKGPLLMVFELKFKEGLLKTLGGKEVGDLFDVRGASFRVLRCPKPEDLETLKKYCATLSE
jgi:hypothetical protein